MATFLKKFFLEEFFSFKRFTMTKFYDIIIMTGNRAVRYEYSSSVAMRRLERRIECQLESCFERRFERQLEHRLERERGAENSSREGIRRVSKRYGESPDKEKNGVKEVRGTPREKKKRC